MFLLLPERIVEKMYSVRTELINEKTFIAGFAKSFHWFNFPEKYKIHLAQIFRNSQQMLKTEINYDQKFNKLQKGTYESPMHVIQ